MSGITKIHVNSSTKVSLNERFTAISALPATAAPRVLRQQRVRRLSGSDVPTKTTIANRRLLQQLTQKHKMAAALKIKKRNLKPTRNRGVGLPRNSRFPNNIQNRRINGKLATLQSDTITTRRSRSLRRSNSTLNLAARLGANGVGTSPIVGARKLRINRNNTNITQNRSNSRTRGRSRSRNRSNITQQQTARSNSRSRPRSLSRGRQLSRNIPITSRLGFQKSGGPNKAYKSKTPNGRIIYRQGQNAQNIGSVPGGGIRQGRITRRRNSDVIIGQQARPGRLSRSRARTNSNNGGQQRTGSLVRSRSSQRIQPREQRSRSLQRNQNQGPRGRSLQRNSNQTLRGRGRITRGGERGGIHRGGRGGGQKRGGGPPRRSRSSSQSRGIRGARGGRRPINQRGGGGKQQPKGIVKKEDLDKELDQYMATTKADMEF